MFKEAINNYLHAHGYESIDLKAVLFDMDGVLFDSMPNHAEAWHKIMKRFGFRPQPRRSLYARRAYRCIYDQYSKSPGAWA